MRNPTIFFLSALICCTGLLCNAQNRTTDSLLSLIKKDKEDTTKVNHLNAIASELRSKDPQNAIEKAAEALALAKKLDFQQGVAEADVWMGSSYYNLGKAKEALSHLLKGKTESRELKLESLEAKCLLTLGLTKGLLGNFNEALSDYNDALKILEPLNDKKYVASAHNNIGNVHNSQGNYTQALSHHLKALKLRIELNDKTGQAGSYNNLGNVYKNLNNMTEALDYYYKAVKINTETGNKNWLANNYANISTIYYNLAISSGLIRDSKIREEYYTQARETAQKGLKIKENSGDMNYIASVYSNLALIDWSQAYVAARNGDKALAKQKLSESLNSYKSVLKMRAETGDKDGLSKALGNMGLVYTEMKDYNEARNCFQKSLDVSKEIGSRDQIKAVYSGLVSLDSITGNYKAAFINYRLYIEYRDSMINEENTKKQVETRLNYEFEAKRTADSLNTRERESKEQLKHHQEIKQQRLYTFGGLIGFVLMIVVAGVSFKAFHQKQRANAIITAQNLKLESKQKEVMDSIQYAQRIQSSLLPSEKYIAKKLEHLKNKK